MKLFLRYLLLLVCWCNINAQSGKQVDSLENLLGNTENDSLRHLIQKKLYSAFYDSIPEKAKRITQDMIDESRKSKYQIGEAGGHYLRGHYFVTKSEFDSANFHLHKSLAIGLSIKEPKTSLNALEWIINVHQKKDEKDSALIYIEKALEIAEAYPEVGGEKKARIKLNQAKINYSQGDNETAIKQYVEADSYLGEEHIGLKGFINASIGLLYYRMEQDEKAENYYLKALSAYEKTGNKNGYYFVINKLGNLQMAQEHYENAKAYYLDAYKHFKSVDGYLDLAAISSNLGYVYLSQEQFGTSENYFKEALQHSKKSKSKGLLPYINNGLGELFTQSGRKEGAVAFYKVALNVSEETGNDTYTDDSYSFLITTLKEIGNFQEAFEYQSMFMARKDSIAELDEKAKINEIETKYQSAKKEQEILFLTTQSELTQVKAKNQRSWFIAGLLILAVAVLALYVLFRNKQQTNFKLRQLESAKSRFFANISHEFRTPLTLISGPVAHQLSKPKLSQEDKVDLGLIQRNANRLLSLVDQLLDLSKIEAGRRDLKLTKRPLDLFIEQIIESFEYQAKQKDIAFRSKINIEQDAWFDRDVIEKIITNLVSNAIKYSPKKGEISFSAILASNEKDVEIRVTNPNTDIPEKELPTLFDRFYQNKTHNEGFGIGLSLVKELTHLSKGSVNAHKPSSETISFVVSIPIVASAFEKQDFSQPEDLQYDENIVLAPEMELLEEEENSLNGSLPLLLVVDDNEEIRLFIKSLLKRQYRILEAENGAEGVQKALEVIPDLVISDVMMPVKDGIYLSDQLKKDERTSHIPIILLTAKSGEDHELTGLRTGADVYMTKPFKEEKLRVVIEKLIASRTTIQEKFSQQVILKPKEIKLTPIDVKLLERIQHILDEQLTDPNFGAKSFSDEIGLSRMHLHRKLKALTGLSTSEFIRTQRLKLAAKLLKDGDANISEIGYTVGFNQPAYFSTAFKQHFGCSPSEFV